MRKRKTRRLLGAMASADGAVPGGGQTGELESERGQ
jgi:hypothetical protein